MAEKRMRMPIKLSELKNMTTTLEVRFRDTPLVVKYYPAAFTPDVGEVFNDQIDNPQSALAKTQTLLLKLLAEVDITDEEGNPYQITEEFLKQLPAKLLDDMLGVIFDDMRVGEANGATSEDGSSTPAAPVELHSGTSSSGRRST